MFERDKRRTNHVVSLRFLFKKKFTEAAGMFQEHVYIMLICPKLFKVKLALFQYS